MTWRYRAGGLQRTHDGQKAGSEHVRASDQCLPTTTARFVGFPSLASPAFFAISAAFVRSEISLRSFSASQAAIDFLNEPIFVSAQP